MNKLNNDNGGPLMRMTEKLQMLNKLLTEGASLDWVMEIFITTTVLAQEQLADEGILN